MKKMKKIFSFLVLLIAFSMFGQVQTFNTQVKFNNVPAGPDEEYVLVQGTDKVVKKVLKSSLATTTPSLQAVTNIGDSTSNSIYSTNSVNAVDAATFDRLSLKSDALYFIDEAAGATTKLLRGSGLTPLVSVVMPTINGKILTTSGTEGGFPVTGNLEFTNDVKILLNNVAGDIAAIQGRSDGVVELSSDAYNVLISAQGGLSVSNGIETNSIKGNDGIYNELLIAGSASGKGLVGVSDFSANYDDNTYVQNGYLNKRFAGYLQSGTAIKSDLLVDLGDVNGDNNGTRLRIDDDNNSILAEGQVQLRDALVLLNGGTGALLRNKNPVERIIDLPPSAGILALESKSISKTTTEINALVGMQIGDYYFNTTLGTICFYDGTGWKRVTNSSM